MKKRSRGKKKKTKDGSVNAAAKKILRRNKSTTSKKKKGAAASSSGKKNAESRSSAVRKRIVQNARSLSSSIIKKGGKKKKKKKKSKKRENDGGGFFLGGDDDDDNPFLNKEQPLTAEELEMRKAAEEQREMTERFQMAAEDLLTANRALSADDGEVNEPHERLALGCQVRAQYGGKDKVMFCPQISSQSLSYALTSWRWFARVGLAIFKSLKSHVAN